MQCMLAGKCEDIAKLRYPVLASVKLDGVRCIVLGGKLLSRNLKPIKNSLVQERFAGLPDGLDGELILGDPTREGAYRETVSAVMGEGNNIDGLVFHVFDNFKLEDSFRQRLDSLQQIVHKIDNPHVRILSHILIPDCEDLNVFEETAVNDGHEGIMVRDPHGPYKNGRSTAKEGYLLKIKRFEDSEAEVIGVEELMHNGNEAKTNALGHTERSSHKANLTGLNKLGALCVRGVGGTYSGVEFNIGTGFDDAQRVAYWKDRKSLIGKVAKFKYFPLGSKDKPRFPVFLGWRDKDDM